MEITALVPIKEISERLPGKNFRNFCGQPLYRVILGKLQHIDLIKTIVINTDSEIIANDCKTRYEKAVIIKRPQEIRGDAITMNTIINYDLNITEGEHFLQTHCTNPLLTEKTIITAIHAYFNKLNRYDSLCSVQEVKKRAYNPDGSPVNHTNVKLEQTQNLPPVLVEDSNIFLFSRTSFYNAMQSRIGKKVQLFPIHYIEGMDIDYAEDFALAELICKNKDVFHCLS